MKLQKDVFWILRKPYSVFRWWALRSWSICLESL